MKPVFFTTSSEFRAWLTTNHTTARELLVGFYKTKSGKPSITWVESVEQALCFGWIDSVRKSVDETRYTIRFTPRKRDSIWSAINIRHVERLKNLGLMAPAGIKAHNARSAKKSRIYSYEQSLQSSSHTLDASIEEKIQKNKKAWKFFTAQAPWYKRNAIHWATRAAREETRKKRLNTLIEVSENENRLPHLNWKKKS